MAVLGPAAAERVQAGLQALVATGRLPSAAWAVVTGGTPEAGGVGGAGPDSVFQAGSVTKAFTGLLLADLAERGEVRLADPATRYLPGAEPGEVTLLDLATQRSGLPRLPPGLARSALLNPLQPYARFSERRLLKVARRSLAGAAGGQPYEYSNYGFGLLGYLLGQAAGRPYVTLVHERVSAPLGLRSSNFESVPVPGYHRRRPVPPWQLDVLAGAGGLHSTAADLGTLLAACLDPASTPLEAAVRSAALTPRAVIGPGREIGLGWHHRVRDGHRVIWHNGMTAGYSAMVAFSPSRHTGIAVLANDGTPPSPLDQLVLDIMFD